MFRKTLATLGVAAALTLVPTAAYALDCTNVSRPAYTGELDPLGPGIGVHVQGNWAYIVAPFTPPEGAWIFLPPGSDIAQLVGTPGAPGNFQNGEGFALLYNAVCGSDGNAAHVRQTEHGIQLMSGCGEVH